jgi:hypothetical protein
MYNEPISLTVRVNMPDVVTYFGYIPNEVWSGLTGALIAGVMSSLSTDKANKHNLVTLQLQHEHDERLHSQRISKERLEELYVLVSQWGEYSLRNSIKLRRILEDNGDLANYVDMLEAGVNKPNYDRMEMILNIYGGEAQSHYAEAMNKRDAINQIYLNAKRADRNELHGAAFAKALRPAEMEFMKASDALKLCIAKVAREV